MSLQTKRPPQAAAGLLVALTIVMPAACGSPRATVGSKPHEASFDQALHDRLPPSVLERGVIRIGTDASYPPMSTFGPDGRTIIGMEPDLGAEIGRVLGVRVEFVNTDFTKLLSDVAGGELDLGMSAMTDTVERARTVDFVNYFSAGTSIVVQRGNPAGITDIQDLCGQVVAVEAGTTQVDLLSRTQSNCTDDRIIMKEFTTSSDALLQLRTGRAVALLIDNPPAVLLVSDRRTTANYQLASTTQYEPGLYGILVANRQLGLRDAVQGALEELMHSGVYGDVLTRWGTRDGAVDRVSINSDR
jgi:polar amino acid transport system substrate-binding protein